MATCEYLKVSEEKRPVLNDWSADGGPVLVLREMSARDVIQVIEIGVGVERAVAEKFPDVAMKLIGSGFDTGVNDRACRGSKFRRVRSRLYAELLQRVRRGLDNLHRAFLQVG